MSKSLLEDAFAHNVWATLRLIDACLALSPEQLGTAVPGTYGSILDTARHLVGSDYWYLFRMTGDRTHIIDEGSHGPPGAPGLDGAKRFSGRGSWPRTSTRTILVGSNDDGSVTHAVTSIRIAQVLHHGTDHRSQMCTAITTLGVEPPAIDVWAYGEQAGRVVEVPPTS